MRPHGGWHSGTLHACCCQARQSQQSAVLSMHTPVHALLLRGMGSAQRAAADQVQHAASLSVRASARRAARCTCSATGPQGRYRVRAHRSAMSASLSSSAMGSGAGTSTGGGSLPAPAGVRPRAQRHRSHDCWRGSVDMPFVVGDEDMQSALAIKGHFFEAWQHGAAAAQVNMRNDGDKEPRAPCMHTAPGPAAPRQHINRHAAIEARAAPRSQARAPPH